ncbi:dTDP-4-dehydrorhamnose 3,5-epimerase family protein [Brevundimonas naejangsanensis]|uniref:dTDP-4-dehydrorhamnose 3,5-epimerase family protein n=1 Tax=Brevundimonas naejangsanensis TaxID=588932 RepID=UPI002285D52B|nr:dTDP-4-dehydrorhamnose 3,5-epimerase [Brevundimonas naejangsanensis]
MPSWPVRLRTARAKPPTRLRNDAGDLRPARPAQDAALRRRARWFAETWSRARFAAAGIDCDFVQDNQSRSQPQGVVRGLHFQTPPYAQAKLVRCLRGAILDVAVDLRLGAATFGQAHAVELSADSGDQLFIPPGFAHGFVPDARARSL